MTNAGNVASFPHMGKCHICAADAGGRVCGLCGGRVCPDHSVALAERLTFCARPCLALYLDVESAHQVTRTTFVPSQYTKQ